MSVESVILLTISSPFWKLVWNLGAIVLFFLGFVLIAVILIQDSKEGGLGGAFGGGMGSESVLGARGQKGITRFTGILGAVTGLLLMGLVIADHPGKVSTLPGDRPDTPEASTASDEEGGTVPAALVSPEEEKDDEAPAEQPAPPVVEPKSSEPAETTPEPGATKAPEAPAPKAAESPSAGESGAKEDPNGADSSDSSPPAPSETPKSEAELDESDPGTSE